MNNTLIEQTGLVWDRRNLYGAFAVLKSLYNESNDFCLLIGTANEHDLSRQYQDAESYTYLTETFPALKELISPEAPTFQRLKQYCYGWDYGFTLIHRVNDAFLWQIALSLNTSPNWSIDIFSERPDEQWLEQFLQDWTHDESLASVTVKHWNTLIHQFKFSLFTLLPDWDFDENILIISQDKALFEQLRTIAPEVNHWENLKMDMFPPD